MILPGAVAVGEGVELLDIPQRMVCLAFDPCPEAGLQGRVIGLERPRGQERAVLEREDERLVFGQGNEHRIEFDRDGVGAGGSRLHVGRHYAQTILCALSQRWDINSLSFRGYAGAG